MEESVKSEPGGSQGPEGSEMDFLGKARVLWASLPSRPHFLIGVAAWFALFHFFGNSSKGYVDTGSLFAWLDYCYQTPDDSHGALVPFLVLGLLIWKGDRLAALPKAPAYWALALVVLGLALHYLGYSVQQTRLSLAGFLVGLYGVLGAYFGGRFLMGIWFPYFLLAFCMPVANYLDFVTVPLRHVAALLSAGFANVVLGIEVYREGTQIFSQDDSFRFDVAPACSGIRGLMTLLALTTVYAFVTLRGTWRRLVMIALAAPLALMGNWARITTVIIVASSFDQDTAMLIEQKFGFVTFAVALGIVMLVGRWLEAPAGSRTPSEPQDLNPQSAGEGSK